MRTTLTVDMLNYLIGKGYKYFLSERVRVDSHIVGMNILITPVKIKPIRYRLAGYDNYYNVGSELTQLVKGNTLTLVMVEITEDVFLQYIDFASKVSLKVSETI